MLINNSRGKRKNKGLANDCVSPSKYPNNRGKDIERLKRDIDITYIHTCNNIPKAIITKT